MNHTPVNGMCMCDKTFIHSMLVDAAHHGNIETIQFIVSLYGISEIILNELLWIAEKFHKTELYSYLCVLNRTLGYSGV